MNFSGKNLNIGGGREEGLCLLCRPTLCPLIHTRRRYRGALGTVGFFTKVFMSFEKYKACFQRRTVDGILIMTGYLLIIVNIMAANIKFRVLMSDRLSNNYLFHKVYVTQHNTTVLPLHAHRTRINKFRKMYLYIYRYTLIF